VAAALSAWIQEDDRLFFRVYQPNRHVYRLILQVAYNSDAHLQDYQKKMQARESAKKIGTSDNPSTQNL